MQLMIYGEISGKRVLVGTLETVPGDQEQFTYDRSFLHEYPGTSLSLSLPPQEDSFPAKAARSYFRNLLPEGAALSAVAKELEVKSSSYLKLLSALGSECIGALTVVNTAVEEEVHYGYQEISRGQLAEAYIPQSDGFARMQAVSRLSLAGAQSKTGVLAQQQNGVWNYAIPQGGAASTHIIKSMNRRFKYLSENEYCCLKTAERCGLSVPAVHIDVIEDNTSVFLIERYDRVEAKNEDGPATGYPMIKRIHQEDFCQILGWPPNRKYEESSQSYANQALKIIDDYSKDPISDRMTFIKLLVFNVAIGNCDGHMKNLSLLRGRDWKTFSLAPLYDLVSTVVYGGLERKLAMRVGTSRRVDKVTKDDFFLLAKEAGLTSAVMDRLLDEVCSQINDSISEIVDAVKTSMGLEDGILDEVVVFAKSQVKRLM